MLADHAPHELLGEWYYVWPLAVCVLVVSLLFWLLVAQPRNSMQRFVTGFAIAIAAALPALIIGYCSRWRFIAGMLIFAAPTMLLWSRDKLGQRTVMLGGLAAAGTAVLYLLAVRSLCWEDSYTFYEGPQYPILMAAPATLLWFGSWAQSTGATRRWVEMRKHRQIDRVTARETEREQSDALASAAPLAPEVPADSVQRAGLIRRLLIAPLIVGVALLPTLYGTIAGVVLVIVSIAVRRAAAPVANKQRSWSVLGMGALVIALLITGALAATLLIWTVRHSSSFSSPWSSVAVAVCLFWSVLFLTQGSRVILAAVRS